MPCVERSDRQTCLEGFTSGRPQAEIDSKMPIYGMPTGIPTIRIDGYICTTRLAGDHARRSQRTRTTDRPVKTPNIDVLPFVPCQNRVLTLCVGAAGVSFERKADSPTY